MPLGIGPWKLLVERERNPSFLKLKMDSGMLPVRLFE
jgi:hypothetical protein